MESHSIPPWMSPFQDFAAPWRYIYSNGLRDSTQDVRRRYKRLCILCSYLAHMRNAQPSGWPSLTWIPGLWPIDWVVWSCQLHWCIWVVHLLHRLWLYTSPGSVPLLLQRDCNCMASHFIWAAHSSYDVLAFCLCSVYVLIGLDLSCTLL